MGASRMQFKKLQDQKLALYCCQRAIRAMMLSKFWLWTQLWLAIKPNLKCTQFGKYKKEFEDKIALATANIDKAVADRATVQAAFDNLNNQKNDLVLALKSGGSAVQDIIDKTIRIEGMAADVQKSLEEVNIRIKGEKEQKNALDAQFGKINAQVAQLKEEIAHQSEMLVKLGKEKRGVTDSRQKTEEDI